MENTFLSFFVNLMVFSVVLFMWIGVIRLLLPSIIYKPLFTYGTRLIKAFILFVGRCIKKLLQLLARLLIELFRIILKSIFRVF